MVRRGESHHLKWHPDTPRSDGWWGRPTRILIGSQSQRRRSDRLQSAFEPTEESRDLLKELLEWGQCGKLVSEHVAPLCLQFMEVRPRHHGCGGRNWDVLDPALLLKEPANQIAV